MINVPSPSLSALESAIDSAYSLLENEPGAPLEFEAKQAIGNTVSSLNRGRLRVAEKVDGKWSTYAWIKKAILLYFKTQIVEETGSDPFLWLDKVPVKKWEMEMGVRAVPPATVRYGAYVARGCVLMPSYVNIGAYVDEGTMVDTWATVGSCAQIGKNVHLSGGVGIGGVLEPPQADPVIIEDNCFIGSRCVIVEGVRIESGAVLGAGVVITQSTPILDVRGSSTQTLKGVVPANTVVIPGTRPKKFPAGEFQIPCALIVGERNASTDSKISLNQTLREFEVPV